MREHLIAEDSVRDLRRVQQVHLQQLSLQMTLLRLVLLERIQQKARRGLNHILRHENIDDALDVDQRTALIVHELGGELGALVRVCAHDVLQKADVVGVEADFVGVEQDLVRLAGLGEAGDDLVRDVCAEVDA